MPGKRKTRNDQEWLELIQECRASGLSDREWCQMHSRTELRITPAKVGRVCYMQEGLTCPECRKDGEGTIVQAETPTPLMAHSPASPSVVAYVMSDKSFVSVPYYRQEACMDQLGLGYARVSTEVQNLDKQIDALVAAGVSKKHLYCEKMTGTKSDRPELNRLINDLEAEDTVIIAD